MLSEVSSPLSLIACFHKPCGRTLPNTRPAYICILLRGSGSIHTYAWVVIVQRPSVFITQLGPLIPPKRLPPKCPQWFLLPPWNCRTPHRWGLRSRLRTALLVYFPLDRKNFLSLRSVFSRSAGRISLSGWCVVRIPVRNSRDYPKLTSSNSLPSVDFLSRRSDKYPTIFLVEKKNVWKIWIFAVPSQSTSSLNADSQLHFFISTVFHSTVHNFWDATERSIATHDA